MRSIHDINTFKKSPKCSLLFLYDHISFGEFLIVFK